MKNVNEIRADFPLINEKTVYFDNAATTHRPAAVTAAIKEFYDNYNANPLRGLYDLSSLATEMYGKARTACAAFINAKCAREIIFTRNTTESINLAAYSLGELLIGEGDNIVISVSEHHSNLLPWQRVARQKKANLVFMEPDMTGLLSLDEIKSKIDLKTKIVSIGHVSNVWGRTNPIKEIVEAAHKVGAVVVVDGAQAAPHMKVDVRELDVDFYAFSGHKMLGPMGIGCLYGKLDLLDKMPPFLMGGEMIEYVTRTDATFAEIPHKFEAGTVNAADAYALNTAIGYINEIGFDYIENHEKQLTARVMEGLSKNPYVTVYGSPDPEEHCGIVTFNLEGVHPHDLASVLNDDGICIRAGHHCAQPLMQFMGVGSTARLSLYLYNTDEEVDFFLEKLSNVRNLMGYGS
ncbi:MAG: SufS family cysteine desulfurase [Clostridiales bacterium]|nr:SufS family cysteine desulfurase [Clostridiales bacterium]